MFLSHSSHAVSVLCNNYSVNIANSVNSDSTENFNNLKSRWRDCIRNATKCINRVTILADDMNNYDEVYYATKSNLQFLI